MSFLKFFAILVPYLSNGVLLIHKYDLKEIAHALINGKMAIKLIDWDIESDWATPLDKVRQKLGVISDEL
ncbi:MAG: hypothetical protein AAF915_31275 [Cyanobacteria bacterium P01_D01_bin.50]